MIVSGKQIHEKRLSLGLSLEVVAQVSDTHISTLSRWESGEKMPPEGTRRRVVAALTNLETLKTIFDPVPLDFRATAWITAQIEKLSTRVVREAEQVDLETAAAQLRRDTPSSRARQ